MRSSSTEDALSEWLGRTEALEGLWVRITNHLEYLESDGRHLILGRDPEEGRKCGEIRHFPPFGESVGRRLSVGGFGDMQAERRTPGSISF